MKRATVVGAGISGLTAAYLLVKSGWQVVIYEQRNHVGGNCFDVDCHGMLVHVYGPHLFHTNDDEVAEFVKAMAEPDGVISYDHRVMANTSRMPGFSVPIPYNKTTEAMFGSRLTTEEIRDTFFVDYSQKMWGLPFEELPEHITSRVPVRRDNDDDRYFTDRHQFMPVAGFRSVTTHMLCEIGRETLFLNQPVDAWRKEKADLVVYTGSIDTFHRFTFGWLPYRSLRFSTAELPADTNGGAQSAVVVNECNDKPITRTTDYGLLANKTQRLKDNDTTICVAETPCPYTPVDERFYPMNWGGAAELYEKYAAEPTGLDCGVVFLGRLGRYRYLNIDQVIREAFDAMKPYV
jgi:UDP-galactopyranose mutase